MKIELFDYTPWKPFESLGLTAPFWTIHLDTILYTWVAMAIIALIALIGRRALRNDKSMLYCAYEQYLQIFIDLCKDSLKSSEYRYVRFLSTLFLFTAICCMMGILPFLDEPTKDLNTTLALALVSFFYVTYQKIATNGLLGYLREFIEPTFFLAPIHLVGEFSKVASMSFRLFGNILGGSVILSIVIGALGNYREYYLMFAAGVLLYTICLKLIKLPQSYWVLYKIDKILYSTVYIITGIQLLFGILEGIVQAFVLTMLTATYLGMGIASESDESPCENELIKKPVVKDQ